MNTIEWTPEMDALLGTVSDVVVAAKLGVGKDALFSTLGRIAARALETQVLVNQLSTWVDQLEANMQRGELTVADSARWTPESWPAEAQGPRVPLPTVCQVPDELLTDSSPLPNTVKQLRSQRLKIVALGSSSTLGMGASGPESAYPARLEAALKAHFPAAAIQVSGLAV